MKLINISYQDINSGAARAAFRIHKNINNYGKENNMESSMRVIKKFSNDRKVIGGFPNNNSYQYYYQKILNRISRLIFRQKSYQHFSTAWPATGLGKELNTLYKKNRFDILMLHFLGDNTLSINEISKLNAPILWILHDQWALCGLEHYTQISKPDLAKYNYQTYLDSLKSKNLFRKPDFNNFFLQKKLKLWHSPKYVVAPTTWMANCAKNSPIFEKADISIIPYPIDLDLWSPIDKELARRKLNLSHQKIFILFGALTGTSDRRKGADLLFDGIRKLKTIISKSLWESIELIVFGQDEQIELDISKEIKIHSIGRINDDKLLNLYYAASDLFVLPSRQDNLPSTGTEAQACGTPVVAFNTGGMPDIVDHRKTGALAKAFDVESLAKEIKWVINKVRKDDELSIASRERALSLWEGKKISAEYKKIFRKIIT